MSLFNPQPEIERRFSAEFTEEWTPRYNIAPQQKLAAIRNDAPEVIDQLEWGLVPAWVGTPDDSHRRINARAESVSENGYFRSAFNSRRCLILADGFYEWYGPSGAKRPHRIERVDEAPFAFAGLWESWGSTDEELRTATVITTDANDVVEPIHDRMPVMLEPDEEHRWLDEDDPDELRALLDPYPDDLTDAYEVTTKVNDPSNDTADIIERMRHGQSGFEAFR